MLKEFFLFELRSNLTRPMIYIFALINFLFAFAATVSESVVIGVSSAVANANSPHTIMTMVLVMTLVGLFMTTAIITRSILKDFSSGFDGILFSTPLQKRGYLGGRFFAAFVLSLIPIMAVMLGIFLAAQSPWINPEIVGPFQLKAYIAALLLGALPNTFFCAAVGFCLASIFKSTRVVFVGALVVLISYMLLLVLTGNFEREQIALLADPLAINSYDVFTSYWTKAEMNTLSLGLSGPIFINRLIWILCSCLLILIAFARFSFSTKKSKNKSHKAGAHEKEVRTIAVTAKPEPILIPYSESASLIWMQLWQQIKMETMAVLKSTPFLIMLLLAVINMFGAITFVSGWFGTGNHPVTYLMIEAVRNSYHLLFVAIIMFYSGTMIWRERDARMSEFMDAAPIPNWLLFTAKFSALIVITVLLLLIAIFACIAVQAQAGYHHYDLPQYLRAFLIYDLLGFISLIALSMMIHSLVNNKYLGFFTFIALVTAFFFGPQLLEVSSNLLVFGNAPGYIYSDMNAWGPYASGLNWFHTYWLLFSGILAIVGILFWVRGRVSGFAQRLQLAGQRLTGRLLLFSVGLFASWFSTAGFLLYQTTVLNEMTSEQQQEYQAAEYERRYKQYEHLPQPRITDVDFTMNLFPTQRDFNFKAELKAVNKTDQPISCLHFSMQDEVSLQIKIDDAALAHDDQEIPYQIFDLSRPMLPGDTLAFVVQGQYASQGIENEVSNTQIVANGSFIGNYQVMPIIGYSSSVELEDKNIRAEHGLPARPDTRKLHANCSKSCGNTYISNDSDWVKVSSIVSTEIGQTAVAPGSLTAQWQENGRSYFEYKLEQPVINFFSFVSARYEIERDLWISPEGKEVDVEVYYHEGHDYNVQKMIDALKQSLTYYSEHLSPYPHQEARIIEFPRYQRFAQAFPGTMPYSESMGFIADLLDEESIDMVTYVVAHEMAHQWWAHQVIGADLEGATMLSETFAQYGALMVMKQMYGEEKMQRFMRYEMDRYLRMRGRAADPETALLYTDDSPYIHYRKGSVVMYALQDYIGERALNNALRQYADAVAYQEPPYTTSLEAISYLKAATPDSLQYFVKDMFEQITLYNNRMDAASYKSLPDGRYEVLLDFTVEKLIADSLGREQTIEANDYIDLAVYGQEEELLAKQRVKLASGPSQHLFVVNELPVQAGIDPNYLLIDRIPRDNIIDAEEVL